LLLSCLSLLQLKAEIAPWIHHSRVKSASPLIWLHYVKSPCGTRAPSLGRSPLPRKQQGPCSRHLRKLTNTQLKLEESTLQWDKRTVFYTSYLTVIYCHSLSVSVAVVLTPVFVIGLAKTSPADWIHGERLLLAFFYLFWAGCIITVYCY
jgi:hypothetical protein